MWYRITTHFTCVAIYNTVRGTNATTKRGVEYEIVKMTLTIVKRQPINESMVEGISSSMTLISLEKRLVSLPMGVVSKKSIGHRKTFFRRLLCSFLAATQDPIVIVIPPKYWHTQCPKPSKPYTSRYLSRSLSVVLLSELQPANQILAPTRKNFEPSANSRTRIVASRPIDLAYVTKTEVRTCKKEQGHSGNSSSRYYE